MFGLFILFLLFRGCFAFYSAHVTSLGLQVTRFLVFTGDLPRDTTFAGYGHLIAGIYDWAIGWVRDVGKPLSIFTLFEIKNCILSERYVFGEEIMEVVRQERVIYTPCKAKSGQEE